MKTDGMRLTLTRTACKVAAKKGWSAEQIKDAFENPKAVQESKDYPGQYRISNDVMCIVGVPMDDTTFHGITMKTSTKKDY